MPRIRAYRAHLAYTAQLHMRQSFLFSRAYPLAAHEKRHRARRRFDMLFQSAIRAASCKAAESVLTRQSTSASAEYGYAVHKRQARASCGGARENNICYHAIIVTYSVTIVNPPKSYIFLYIIFAAALRAYTRAYALALAYTYRKEKRKAARGIIV